MTADRIAEGIMTYLWMKPQAHRSLQSIERLCKYLCGPDEQDYLRKGREAMRSLMVQGSIEFMPQNNIGLSPSNALSAGKKFYLTNLPLASVFGPVALEKYGVKRGTAIMPRTEETLDQLKRTKVPIQAFRLQTVLTSMATLESVIINWDKAKLINTDAFQVRSDQGFVPAEKSTPDGVYRMSPHPYSQCYLRYGGNWITIPRREENIDGYQMAAFFVDSAVIRRRRQLCYDLQNETLTVKLRNFPVILERLLYINTALGENENADLRARKYAITSSAARKLNQILSDTISTI